MRAEQATDGRTDGRALHRLHLLARGYAALAALTFGLIVLGALVRAHGAGLACPDWPLCFGELVPRFDFHVAFEWGHRLLAGSVSVVFAVLAAATLRDPATRSLVGRWLALAAALLATQVVLGGLTVLHLLAAWTVTAHLLTGNAFAAAVLVTARRLAEAATPPARAPIARRVRWGVLTAAALLVLQVALGGLVSSHYAGLVCPDWPACEGGVFYPSWDGAFGLQLAHRTNAYALFAALAACAALARGAPRIAKLAAFAVALGLAQLALGVANVLLRLPVEVTALHSAAAAGLVLLWTLVVRETVLAPVAATAEGHASRALTRAAPER